MSMKRKNNKKMYVAIYYYICINKIFLLKEKHQHLCRVESYSSTTQSM
jgi:hypothetical protein